MRPASSRIQLQYRMGTAAVHQGRGRRLPQLRHPGQRLPEAVLPPVRHLQSLALAATEATQASRCPTQDAGPFCHARGPPGATIRVGYYREKPMDKAMIKGIAVGGIAMVVLGAGAVTGYQKMS